MNKFQELVLGKYQHTEDETWEQICDRMYTAFYDKEGEMPELLEYFKSRVLMPQGSILYGLGKPGAHPGFPDGERVTISLSNCVVQTIREDSMSDIMATGARAAKCYQYRMGVGTDLSKLRPKGMKVRNAAKSSSGAASFMDYFSTVCGTVGQQGRRGALMLTIDIDHPDVEEFIKAKQKAGHVTNANISVKISDKFMEAVKADDTFDLQWPTAYETSLAEAKGQTLLEPKVYKTVRAKELWNLIVNSAYNSAEPGVLFWDQVLERPHGSYPGSRPVTTNPCSEIPLPDDDVCLLTSIYLPHFVKNPYTDEAYFDFKEFIKVIRMAVEFIDVVKDYDIDMVPFEKIKQQSIDWRRVGVGTHGLGDVFWRMGLAYGGGGSIELTNLVYQNLMIESYRVSVELAEEKGPFPKWDREVRNEWLQRRLPPELYSDMQRFGRRNLHLNTVAPTGSVSVISHNCSSGIEPPFGLEYDRFCLGNVLKSIPHGEWSYFKAITGEDKPRAHMLVADKIAPSARVAVQAAATYWLDHSCSSTVNFLHGTEEEEINKVYFEAWEKGCEGITVFVSGSRDGVVNIEGQKRPRDLLLVGKTYKFGESDQNIYITVNKNERGEVQEVLINNLCPSENLGINDSISALYALAVEKRVIHHLYEYEQGIEVSQKLSVFITILLRCGVAINRILACFEESCPGELGFYVRVAIKSSLNNSQVLKDDFDPACPGGNCG